MKQSLRKSLAGAALAAVIGIAGAGAASAEQAGPVTTTVTPGGRACVVTQQPAYYRVRADGSAPAALSGQAQWTVHQSFDKVNYQTLSFLTLSGSSYSASLGRDLWPQYFPGYWKFCVRNTSTTTNLKATLTLLTDANAY